MTGRHSHSLQPIDSSPTFSPNIIISPAKDSSLILSGLSDNPTISIEPFFGINNDSTVWIHCECVNNDGTPCIITLAEAAPVNTSDEISAFSCELPLQQLKTVKDNSLIKLFIMAKLKKTPHYEPRLFALYHVTLQHHQDETDYARWMTESVPGIEHLKLYELVLASTHNAGVDQKNVGWPTDQWGACQDDSFAYQLNNGARVLDLRLYRNIDEIATPKEFIFKHGSYHASRYLNDCLQAVRVFAQQNPREFVILDFHEVHAADGEQKINSAIIDIIGEHRLPKDASNLTIGEIRNKYPGKNVITAWSNTLSYTTWPKIYHQWIGESIVSDSDLDTFILAAMQTPPTGKLWSMQAVGFSTLNGPIRYDANKVFWTKFFDEKFYNNYRHPTKGNIINVDFLVGTGAVQKCINATRMRAAAAANSAPRNLSAPAVEASWTLLSWETPQDTEQVIGYSLFRDDVHIMDVEPNEPAIIITHLRPDTAYKFLVIAKYPSGNGAPSVATVTTKSPRPTAPTKPKNAIAHDKTHNSVTLSWAAASPSENVAGYLIWVNDGDAITTTGTSYRITGLRSGLLYAIYISAFNSSNEVSGGTAIIPFTLEPLLPPDTPKNFRGTALPGKIKLDWDSAVRAVRYQIHSVFSTIFETTETTCTFEHPALLRDFSVVAINEHGEPSVRSNSIWLKPLPPEPSAPKNFRVVGTGRGYVKFAWDISPHAVSYELNRLGSILPVGSTPDTTLTLSGLATGVLRYNVVAVYADGTKSEKSDFLWAGPPS